MNVACFYHVYQSGNWIKLVEEQLSLLKQSGLYNESSFIHIGINGTEPFPFLDEKFKIVRNSSPELEESQTLEALRSFCDDNEDWCVLYFHTKGVTHQTAETTDWRKVMEYFCVERWRECLEKLKVHDTVGCLYMDNCYLGFYPHYSGNFWWSKSEYIKTLDHGYLRNGIRNNREFWIGTGKGSMFSFLNTGLNHYAVRFPREIYAQPENNESLGTVQPMKIAVYTITKNEEKFIQRWADSCKEADYRLIVDTGSTDNTLAIAELTGCHTASINIDPWRFDHARNAALALLPNDIDMCVSLDADEVLQPGWRQHLESLPSFVTRPRYKYVWSWNDDGTEGITFLRDHIHRRHGYKWKHPVHEILIPTGEEVQMECGLEVHHHPDPTKSRGQYLPLLELAVKEDPDDDRNRFYLARELMYYGRGEESVPHFLRHLELSTWASERSASMRYLARVTNNREHWLLRACAESPERREAWVDLSQHYYDTHNWEGSLYAATRALSIVEKPLEYLCEPSAWGSLPHDLAAVAAWNLDLKRRSLDYMIKAIEITPDDGRLRTNAMIAYENFRKKDVGVTIPCKSNISGLLSIIEQLQKEESVKRICVVADGPKAYKNIKNALGNSRMERVKVVSVDEGEGIHAMWNLGSQILRDELGDVHILFANDDIDINLHAIDTMAGVLDVHDDIGVICPNYDDRVIAGHCVPVTIACPGKYDGTDGLAGFCFLLRSNLAHGYSFDERMKWYYGDNDVVNWVRSIGKVAAISGVSTMKINPSWTKNNDPPKDFNKIIENDRKIFESKWSKNATI